MTLPNTLNSVIRKAAAIFSGVRPSRAGSATIRFALLLCVVGLGACSDMTSPQRSMDRAAVDSLMPSVLDARLRVAGGIKDIATRQKVEVSLSSLEVALKSDNAQHAHDNIQSIATLLDGYRVQSSTGDGADISAIFITLNAVSVIVDAGNAGSPQ
jgi:hypothetical protein